MAARTWCFDDTSLGCAPEDVSADPHVNRPGLPALAYRRGTHPSILARLKARLESPLQGTEEAGDARDLNIQASDDPAVALLDAFSAVADVLTFYQERIADEGFMGTATEQTSVLALADMLGYRPSPGVAASVDLVFTVDPSDKAPGYSTVPEGTRVLHIPGQDETPQPFETSEELEARAEWNELKVPAQCAQDPLAAEKAGTIVLDGVATGLRPHQMLLLVYGSFAADGTPPPWRVHRLGTVTSDSKEKATTVTWDPERSLGTAVADLPAGVMPTPYALRTRTHLFGWNAPDWHSLPPAIQKTYIGPKDDPPVTDWPLFDGVPTVAGVDSDGNYTTNQVPVIDLAEEHEEVEPGSFVVVADVSGTRASRDDPSRPLAGLYRVEDAVRVYRQSWRLTGHATRIFPSHSTDLGGFGLRESAVYAASEALTLALVDDSTLVGDATIEVTGQFTSLEGRRVMVTGLPAGAASDADPVSETATVAGDTYDSTSDVTTLTFEADDRLSQTFQRDGTVVSGNVVAATHGETVTDEVLGSGDGSTPFQRFALKRSPLTYVSDSADPTGASSTLVLRVGGVAWKSADDLLDLDGRDRAYVTQADDESKTSVVFGDGANGSRLPTGVENVVATYRFGIGEVGEVAADSISLMVKKPFGMRSVTNPNPSSGSEDPETLETSREGAPASVQILERVVSVTDYEHFARAFLGVGKARVAVLWWGDRQTVHLTVTDTDGDVISEDSELYGNLAEALATWGDADVPVILQSLDAAAPGGTPGPRRFGLKARLLVDEDYVREDVVADVQDLLAERFGTDERDLAQPVSASEIVAAIHEVAGVVAVDLDELYLQPRPAVPAKRLRSCVPALPARIESGGVPKVRPAELLLIDPDDVDLDEEMSP